MKRIRRKINPGHVARSAATMTMKELAEATGKKPKGDWTDNLRLDQVKFCWEYFSDWDATLAVQRSNLAGLNAQRKDCYTKGVQYLKDENVQDAIQQFRQGENEQYASLRVRMVDELTKLSFYNTGDYIAIRKNTVQIHDTVKLDERQMQAFKRVKQVKGKSPSMEVEFHDKIKAMELLDRMTGGGQIGIQNNVNINGGKGGIAVQISPMEAMAAGIGTDHIQEGEYTDVTPKTNGSSH